VAYPVLGKEGADEADMEGGLVGRSPVENRMSIALLKDELEEEKKVF
jgi:hypothetical protein